MSTDAAPPVAGTAVYGPAAEKAYSKRSTPPSSVAVMSSATGEVLYQPLWPVAGAGDSVATLSVGGVVSACARACPPVAATRAAASAAVDSARPRRGCIPSPLPVPVTRLVGTAKKTTTPSVRAQETFRLFRDESRVMLAARDVRAGAAIGSTREGADRRERRPPCSGGVPLASSW